jgi:hypothetical protein
MKRSLQITGWLAVLSLAAGSAQARVGVEVAGGIAWSAGAYLNYAGNEFRTGNGFDARVSLILGNWFLGYDYTSLNNGKICGAGCVGSEAYGTTKIHSFTANYRFYFYKGAVKPFLALGIGGLIGTLGDWPSRSAAQNNVFGGDFRGSFGFEIPLGSKLFLSIEGRYRYLLTNNPIQDVQQDLLLTAFLGGSVTDTLARTIQDAHLVQVLAGFGAHF